MTNTEAKEYGKRVKRAAKAAYELGDAGSIVLNADWQVANKSYQLGIVSANGMVDVTGEIARAFKEGFSGKRR